MGCESRGNHNGNPGLFTLGGCIRADASFGGGGCLTASISRHVANSGKGCGIHSRGVNYASGRGYSLPDPIFVKDSGGHFLVANQAAADAMGVVASAEVLGKTDFDFYTKELASGYFEDERKIVLSGQPLASKEEYYTEPSGQTRCLLITKVPLRAASGRIIGIIGIGRNITALKSVEA